MKIQLSDHFTYGKLFRFVFPSIVMMVFTSIYGVVDGFFVSNFVGKTAFSALNLVFPFIMILGGMGFMVGAGGSALIAKELGSGKREKANRYFTILIIFTVIMALTLTIIGIVFIRPAAYLLRATEDMIDYCVLYGRIVISFTVCFMLQNVFQSFLIVAEKPKLGLAVTVAAGVTNMILDAVFIAGFKLGLAGAALATGIGQFVGGILPMIYFLRSKESPIHFTKTKLSAYPILKACANGSSELMSNISASLVSMIYNFQLMRFIGEDGVSAYGVLMYVQFIFIAIAIGYSIGSASIVSYNFGAENHKELKNMFKKGIIIMGSSGIVLTVLALGLAGPLARIFVGYDEGLFQLTKHAFYLFSCSFLLAGFNIFASGFFTALNNGMVSAAISFLRTLLFQTAAVIIMPIFLDVDGIWLAITVSEVFAFMVSLIFLLALRKKYHYA